MSYFKLLDSIKTVLEQDGRVHTITEGVLDEIDLQKKNIYSLSHIIIADGVEFDNLTEYNVELLCLDVITDTNKAEIDKFTTNSNIQDVYEDMHNVVRRFLMKYRKGLQDLEFCINENPTIDKFYNTHNKIAGWSLNFSIQVPNDFDYCKDVYGI